MSGELEVISDGDGVVVLGPSSEVARFVEGLTAPVKDLDLPKLRRVVSSGGATAQASATIAADAGKWIKLTDESARKLKQLEAMKGSAGDVSRAILMEKGKTSHILEFAKTPGAMLSNPAVLTGAAGMMAQLAMQQTMDEITDYLAVIDEKVDDILRAQKDAVVSRMIGAGLVVDEAMTLRKHGGRVSEVTWSKVQTVPTTIADTQAYALRQLDAVAEKLEKKQGMGDLADTAQDAQSTVQEWLAVLARCFQLQDAIGVIELDRVLDAAPEELDAHRIGLRAARAERRELISVSTHRLLERMDDAVSTANAKVLLHPRNAATVVRSSADVAGDLVEFNGLLGVADDREALQARRWAEAAADLRDRALESGAAGMDSARQLGAGALGRARSVKDRASTEASERAQRWRKRGKADA